MHRFLLLAIVLGGLAGVASGAEIGDQAPALQISKWVKGDAVDVTAAKKDRIYVVEFWATWCGPCRMSIPHLTELQARLKDKGVTIVGISDETLEKVEPFVESWGDKMDYTVAVDDERGTSKAYMEAFGIGGIPHAFVVDSKGRIAWHGHPMSGLDRVLDDMIAGTYDIEAVKKEQQAFGLADRYLKAATQGESAESLRELGDQVVEMGGKSAELMNGFAWQILTHPGVTDRDLELGMKAAKLAYEACQGKDASIVDTYARAFYETGDLETAIKHQKDAVKLCTDERLAADLQKTLDRYEKEASDF